MIIRVGYSLFFEHLMMRAGFMFCNIIAARQGTEPYAAHNVAILLLNLSFAFGNGLQAAAVALIGRSLGEGNPEKAKDQALLCRVFGFICAAVLAVIYITCGKAVFGLYFEDQGIVAVSYTHLTLPTSLRV